MPKILEEPTTSEAPAVIITPQLEAYLPLKETEYSGHINQIISTLDQLADCLIAFKKANIYHENITLDTVLADEDYHNRLHIKLHGLADLKTSHKKDEVYLKCEDDARAVCKTVLGVLKQSKRLGDPQLIDFLAEGSSIDSGYEGLTIKRFLNSVYPPDIRDPFQPVKISCDLPITRVKTKFKKECVDIISLFRDTRGSNHGNHEEVAKCFGSMLSSDNLKSNPCYIRRGRVNELQEQLKKQLFKFNWALEERIEDIVKDSNLTITDTSEVTYYVTVHQPSGMFNISQLLRFCPQEAFERFTKLAPSLHSIKLHSVRGDSTWQGEYINEEAFLALVRALGMSIGSYRSPVLSPTLPPWSVSIRKSMGTHIEETSPDIYTTITTDTTTDTTRIRLAQHPHILLASPDLLHFPVYVPSTKIVLWNNKTLSLATALEKCEKYSLRTIKTALEEISQQSILPSPINPEEQIKEQIETQPKQQIKTRPKTQPKEKIETKPQTQLEEQIKQPALSLILHLASPISHLTSLYESNEEILALIRKYATPNTKPPDRRDKSSDEEDMEFRLRKRVKREAEKGTDGKKGKDVGLDKFGIGRVEK